MTTSALVYSSSTGFIAPEFDEPAPAGGYWDDMDWCGVCSRATCHIGEHDDLIEAGFAEVWEGQVVKTSSWDDDKALAVIDATWQAWLAANPDLA